MKKKLLLMVPMLHQGGFERVCIETARLLAQDMDVTILIFSDKNIHYDISGLHVVNMDVPSAKGRLAKVWNVLRRVHRVRKFKKAHPSDYSYSFGSTANIVNALSGRVGRTKVLVGLRNALDVHEKLQMWIYLHRANEILVCSKEIRDFLEREYHYKHAQLIYNPVEVDAIQKQAQEPLPDHALSPDQQHVRQLVTVGRDDWIKGYWHLIKAFSLVCTRLSNVQLTIIGSGSFQKYKMLARTLGIEDRVHFPGVLRNPFPYVAASDLYVMTSNNEGHPNALLEAMALGTPCLAADCRTGPREVLLSDQEYEHLARHHVWESTAETIEGEYGILIRDMSPVEDLSATITPEDENLATELERILLQPERLAHYGSKARERALQMTPAHYREELLRILAALDTP